MNYKLILTLAVSTVFSGCSTYGSLSNGELQKYKITAQHFAEAEAQNLGIILMPTFNLADVQKWNIALADEMNQRISAKKTKMIWQHRDLKESVFLTTTDTALAIEDSRATWMNYGNTDHLYQVFFVKPGVYGLIGSETLELDKELTANGTKAVINQNTLGQSFVKNESVVRYVTDIRWSDAIYNYKPRSESYCTMVHASGTCLAGAVNRYTEQVTTRPAGYYEGPHGDKKPALVFTSFMHKPLATLEVKAGEVLVTDAFFSVGKNVNFQNKSCIEDNGFIQCSFDSFHASLIKASLENYQSAVIETAQADKNISKSIVDTLKKAQYRPLDIFGKTDKKNSSRMGPVYTLR